MLTSSRFVLVIVAACAALLPGAPAPAQPCQPAWHGSVGDPGIAGVVFSLTVFDDGTGPALYAGGRFSEAGGVSVNSLARWDGEEWSDVGGGDDY